LRAALAVAVLIVAAVIGAAPAKEMPGAAPAKEVPSAQAQLQLSFSSLVKKVAPAVVNIYSRKVVRTRAASPLFDDPFFRRFFGKDFPFGGTRERVQSSLGSGVIVDAKGLIVTSHHVIKGSDEITVALADRREFEATIVLADARTDLAVLRIDTGGEKLPFMRLRDSDDLEVGDLVLAIGNPFGVGQTVTSGIVSALARTAVGVADYRFFIQTDASINPGNSGGALVAMDGGLVGINAAIYSRGGGSIGIGFAIPSNMVKAVIASSALGPKVLRPWLGGSGQAVTAEIAPTLGLSRPFGVLINGVHPGGPADRAGLKIGDVITMVGGRRVDDPQALRYRIATLPIGGKTTLGVLRKGRKLKLTVALIAPPEDPPRNVTEISGRNPLGGAIVANLSPALADELSLPTDRSGIVVLRVKRRGLARRFGVKRHDIILGINGREAPTVAALGQILTKSAKRWRIAILRRGQVIELVIDG
jgi:serine protease Do